MSEQVHVGLDFGSLGLRAACFSGGRVVALSGEPGWSDPARWLLCERSPDAAPGVRFVPVKSVLGMRAGEPAGAGNGGAAAVRGFVQGLRGMVERECGGTPGQLAIAVPALYSTARRQALREIAQAAGFGRVRLLNDGMAAAIAHMHGCPEPRTLLVLSMGYSGVEIAVIRAAKSHYRGLAYHGSTACGGAVFDMSVLCGCLLTLAEKGLWWPPPDLAAEHWLAWRQTAQDAKEAFSRAEEAVVDVGIPTRAGRLTASIRVLGADFRRLAGELLARSLRPLERILTEANLAISDIDELVLAGGSTRLELVRHMVAERCSRAPVVLPDEALAQGAALYAAHLEMEAGGEAAPWPGLAADAPDVLAPATRGVTVSLAIPEAAGGALQASLPPVRRVRLTLELPPEAARPEPWPAPAAGELAAEEPDILRQRLLDRARQLAAQGGHEAAARLLEGLIEESQALLAAVRTRGAPSREAAAEALRRAEEFLQAGQYQQAVEQAHVAYSLEPDAPAVFQQMIEVHCRAAMASCSREGYAQAMRWLMCAHGHDSTNPVVHQRIAERHFLHARQVSARGDSVEALRALEECLYYEPEHAQARELQTALRAQAQTLNPEGD